MRDDGETRYFGTEVQDLEVCQPRKKSMGEDQVPWSIRGNKNTHAAGQMLQASRMQSKVEIFGLGTGREKGSIAVTADMDEEIANYVAGKFPGVDDVEKSADAEEGIALRNISEEFGVVKQEKRGPVAGKQFRAAAVKTCTSPKKAKKEQKRRQVGKPTNHL
ncbi:hypothetical protein B0H12DRAFT_1068291 [Mycena haematopus]|nr:hypothetical protein B0H12DRAFT_1068291 [Mycena haematopus]